MNKENQTIIKALNMYGRVPQTYELLNEIERLNNIINELEKWLSNVCIDPQCSFEYRIILDKLKELRGNDK